MATSDMNDQAERNVRKVKVRSRAVEVVLSCQDPAGGSSGSMADE